MMAQIKLFLGVCLLAMASSLSLAAQDDAAPAAQTTVVVPHGPVPRLVKFSGVLQTAYGEPHTGLVGVTFALYREQEGGAPLWLETQNVEADAEGRYNVLLGVTKTEGLPEELFLSGEARWLGIQFKGEKELRVLLVSVPYALKAGDAETLGGKPASAFVLVPEGKAAQTPAPQPANALGGLAPFYTATSATGPSFISLATTGTPMTVASTELVTNLNSDLLDGLHATDFASSASLANKVDKAGDTMSGALNITAAGTGLAVTNNATVGGTLGVTGALTGSTGSFNSSGATLIASSSSTGALVSAVLGQAMGASGTVVGAQGIATISPSGIGVRGEGNNIGVEGRSSSAFGTGVQGSVSDLSGTTFGVIGLSDSSSGTGVQAMATRPTGNTAGLNATAASPNGTAGLFENTAGFVSGAAPGAILQGRAAGQLKFTVDGLGNLTTRGDIKLGPSAALFAASGVENLGVLRGTVGNTGVIAQGTGFTVTKNGTGDYTVNFTTAFSAVPTPVATAHSTIGVIANVLDASTTSFRVLTFLVQAGTGLTVAGDSSFTFIVMGPR